MRTAPGETPVGVFRVGGLLPAATRLVSGAGESEGAGTTGMSGEGVKEEERVPSMRPG